jgi:hypothetical protein
MANEGGEDNVIDIDNDLDEELSSMAMRQGQDDITKFINNLIE